MRITVVTPLYPPDLGKLATYTKELLQQLAQTEEVQLVTYGEVPERVPGVHITAISKRLPVWLRFLQFTARLWWQSRTSDCLYVSDGASVGLPALLVGRARGIPVIRFMLDDETRERAERDLYIGIPEETFAFMRELSFKLRFIRGLQNWIIRQADRVLVPSAFFKDLLVRAYKLPAESLVVAPFPLEQPPKLPFPVSKKLFQLVTQSPLNFFSGNEELIQTLPTLQTQFPEIKLIITDTGPERERLQTLVQKLGLAACVSFIGSISRAERWALLKESSVLILNQTSSNTADAIYQAYEAEIPVIASNSACHAEAIQDQQSGLLIESTDRPALTAAITTLLEERSSLRTHLIAGGKQLLKERGDWTAHIQQILSQV